MDKMDTLYVMISCDEGGVYGAVKLHQITQRITKITTGDILRIFIKSLIT